MLSRFVLESAPNIGLLGCGAFSRTKRDSILYLSSHRVNFSLSVGNFTRLRKGKIGSTMLLSEDVPVFAMRDVDVSVSWEEDCVPCNDFCLSHAFPLQPCWKLWICDVKRDANSNIMPIRGILVSKDCVSQ